MQRNIFGGEDRRGHTRQRRVFGATDRDATFERIAAANAKFVHAGRLKEKELIRKWECDAIRCFKVLSRFAGPALPGSRIRRRRLVSPQSRNPRVVTRIGPELCRDQALRDEPSAHP